MAFQKNLPNPASVTTCLSFAAKWRDATHLWCIYQYNQQNTRQRNTVSHFRAVAQSFSFKANLFLAHGKMLATA